MFFKSVKEFEDKFSVVSRTTGKERLKHTKIHSITSDSDLDGIDCGEILSVKRNSDGKLFRLSDYVKIHEAKYGQNAWVNIVKFSEDLIHCYIFDQFDLMDAYVKTMNISELTPASSQMFTPIELIINAKS